MLINGDVVGETRARRGRFQQTVSSKRPHCLATSLTGARPNSTQLVHCKIAQFRHTLSRMYYFAQLRMVITRNVGCIHKQFATCSSVTDTTIRYMHNAVKTNCIREAK